MRLRITLAEAQQLVEGTVPDRVRERAQELLDREQTVPVIPGQTDLEDMLRDQD